MAQTYNTTSGPKIRKQVSSVKGREYVRWLVDFGMAGNKRHRETFKTEARAKTAIRKWNKAQEREAETQDVLANRIGEKAKKLSTDSLLDASRAIEVLKGSASLEVAARFYVSHHTPAGGEKTIQELYDGYYLSRQLANRRPDTLRDIRGYLQPFTQDFGDTPVQNVTIADLERWMQKQNGSPRTRNKRRIHLVGLFNYAVDRKYCTENPASALVRANVDKTKAYIIPPKDAAALMAYTEKDEPEMAPYLALCLFAGLRPAGEMSRLDWKDIDLDRKEIFITDTISKTGDERYIDIQPNLLLWLEPYTQPRGPIFFSRRKFERIRRKIKIHWEPNCMRHSFGSYHLAQYDNAGKTALQMGHRDIGTLFEYYRRAVRKEDADNFWSIVPADKGTTQ